MYDFKNILQIILTFQAGRQNPTTGIHFVRSIFDILSSILYWLTAFKKADFRRGSFLISYKLK